MKELVEGGRSVSQAKRVLEELAGASRRAAGKLEALLEVCVWFSQSCFRHLV